MVTVSKKREEKLAKLVREFFAVHPDVKLVAITGSAGKASAKIAIGTEPRLIRLDGNYR